MLGKQLSLPDMMRLRQNHCRRENTDGCVSFNKLYEMFMEASATNLTSKSAPRTFRKKRAITENPEIHNAHLGLGNSSLGTLIVNF